ncbi:MAG TPA: hypothetical protein VHZ24_08045 [Pirellulales bacterium]|jgi:hypothetical protein|nr:hypothetical protein [Pirellulales bacterium]
MPNANFEILWFLPGFPLFWCAMLVVLARAGGWAALARRYRRLGAPQGKRLAMQSARFGWIDYNRCLTFWIAADGLYLSVWPMFRAGHPPLLLPWTSLELLKVRDNWWRRTATFNVGSPPIARIDLPLAVLRAAEQSQIGAT